MAIMPHEPASTGKRTYVSASTSRIPIIDLTSDEPPTKRQKRVQTRTHKGNQTAAPNAYTHNDPTHTSKDAAKKSKPDEKRLKRFRHQAPAAYLEVRDRALTQRMFVLDRQRSQKDNEDPSSSSPSSHPVENISLAGTTGNVYTISIDKLPHCDCPHARKGHQCKHIAYVLSRVLRAPAHLEYQLAFLSSELREIFAHAPPLPSKAAEGSEKDGRRKPVDGEECPICCDDFQPGASEAVVYCKAACGNNIHKSCFEQWAATKGGGNVTCPFCRMPWEGDEDAVKKAVKSGRRNEEGYVNVAGQLGLTGRRDYSTYDSHWVRRQVREGALGVG